MQLNAADLSEFSNEHADMTGTPSHSNLKAIRRRFEGDLKVRFSVDPKLSNNNKNGASCLPENERFEVR